MIVAVMQGLIHLLFIPTDVFASGPGGLTFLHHGWGVGCGVWGVGCGVWGVGCGVWGVGCGV